MGGAGAAGASLAIFWFLAFALAWALSVPTALAAHGLPHFYDLPQGAMRLMGFAPTIAALIAAAFTGRLREWWSRVATLSAPLPLYGIALVLPVALLSSTFAWAAYNGHEAPKLALDPQVAMLAGIWFVLAAGEEIGWRAFALPHLAEHYGFWRGATVLGIAWALWHYPMLLASPYITTVDQGVYWIGMFTVQIVLANYVISWLMMKSGAVIVPTLFHTAFNTVSTVYWMASVDAAITASLAAVVLFIAIFDNSPRQELPSAA
jgi:membrane protease YdiL (CAAX protease family)